VYPAAVVGPPTTCITVPSGMLASNEQVVFAQERRFKPTPPVPDTITFSPIVNLLAFTVKYIMDAVLLDPAEFEADTVQM